MKIVIVAVALAVLSAGMSSAAQSEVLAPLDQAVNAMLGVLQAPNREATRVVPILAAGGSTQEYAQIIGPQSRVAATRAVMSVSSTSPNGWNIETLVPVNMVSRNAAVLHREYGVAVDAIVRQGS